MKGLDILFGMMVLNYLSSAALRANWIITWPIVFLTCLCHFFYAQNTCYNMSRL